MHDGSVCRVRADQVEFIRAWDVHERACAEAFASGRKARIREAVRAAEDFWQSHQQPVTPVKRPPVWEQRRTRDVRKRPEKCRGCGFPMPAGRPLRHHCRESCKAIEQERRRLIG